MHRICRVGMALFFCLITLPHVNLLAERYDTVFASDEGESPSGIVRSELELPPLRRSSIEQAESSPIPGPTEKPPVNTDPPTRDKPTKDLKLEMLSTDRPKQAQEFDIPIVINQRVQQFIRYFQTTGRKIFSNWLARSERYIPFMKNLLKENGLPEDLVYMALIESGFNPNAYSRRKASGPWQFIYPTGKKYGLKVNWWVDERRDPEKSTIAAAKYLKDLYDLFECWYLAAAGYNAGEGKIMNAVKRYRTDDFWELTKYRYLKRETKDYVPQMIAAALIAKDPEQYGFIDIEYQEPLQYETVKVPPVTDLRLVAKACEVSIEEIKSLNPELLRWCTPPDCQEYEIRIPLGKKGLFLRNFEALPQQERFQFKTHIVKKGDTLGGIARLYKVDVQPILELNRLKRSSLLSVGMNLLVPIPKDARAAALPAGKIEKATQSLRGEEIIYVVREGDTLWDIAQRYHVTVEEIRSWNSLNGGDRIYPSNRLKLRVGGVRSSTLN
ncbi:MAG: LysM peptidoglycan-binding domain-containing protein [Thermodesulfobacteriota bacterium]